MGSKVLLSEKPRQNLNPNLRSAGSQSHLFFALVVSAQPRPFLWILSLGPCKESIPVAGRDRQT
jgi:hypothetical protein